MDIQQKLGTDRFFPAAMINVTNNCNLRCEHCFLFRDDNPNNPRGEMPADRMLAELRELQQKHSIHTMIWMGGEPLMRKKVLQQGVEIFASNHITTNGTLDLIDVPNSKYVISIDGPPEVNDAIRGKGTWDKIMRVLERVPPAQNFRPTVLAQAVVTANNAHLMQELVELLLPTRIEGMTFSFYVPPQNDTSPMTWGTLENRDPAVREIMRLKEAYPRFVRVNRRTLELTLSENAKRVTDNCPVLELMLPLYQEGGEFTTPFCCYGNDVDCDLCGAWAVFYFAAMLEQGGLDHRPVAEA